MYVCVCECVWGLSSLILVSQLSPSQIEIPGSTPDLDVVIVV